MLKVNFKAEPHYPVNRALIRKAAQITSEFTNLKTTSEMTISIIGDRKMRALNRDFRGQDSTTNVLSFSTLEVDKIPHFKAPETDSLYIGDVAVSFPQALEEAIKDSVLVDERIAFLVVHGMLHLFGHDHERLDEARVMEKIEDQVMKLLTEVETVN